MTPQVKMLKDCIDIIANDKLNQQPAATPENIWFSQLLDWIAVHLCYEVQVVTPPFQMETHDALRAVFNVELLQGDVWDWFGELAKELGIEKEVPGTSILRSEAKLFRDSFAKTTAKHLGGIQDNPVIDPMTGTGRVILAHHEWRDQIIIYGYEKHKVSYRVALLNSFIYGMNVFILHSDPDCHDLSINSKNWLSANQWTPLPFFELLEK